MDPFPLVIARVVGSIALYTLITLLCLLLTRGRGRVAAMLLLIGMLASAELGRALLRDQPVDVTSLVLAVFAWLIAVRTWNAIYPRRSAAIRRPLAAPVRSHLLPSGSR
jgi:hypothetical protein